MKRDPRFHGGIMKRSRFHRGGISEPVFNHHAQGIAHNHMQGSSNCVECAGPCRLTDPTQAAYTGLIRVLFEVEDHEKGLWMSGNPGFKIPYRVERFLWDHGIDVERFRKDAKTGIVLPNPGSK